MLNYKPTASDIVVFDLCGTLYQSNTTFDFLDFLLTDNLKYNLFRKVSRSLILKAANKTILSLFGRDLIREYAVGFLKGYNYDAIQVKTNEFYSSMLKGREILASHLFLKESLQSGARVILVSASIQPVVSKVANTLGFKEFYSSTLALDGWVYTGGLLHDMLLTKDEHLIKMNLDFNKVWFITDNKTDLPIAIKVKEFLVVSKRKDVMFWKKKKGVKIFYEY